MFSVYLLQQLAVAGNVAALCQLGERDILEVLVVSDQSVQDIATTLFLSRSTLYRHISSINKKTGTASRVALINFFWSWTPKD